MTSRRTSPSDISIGRHRMNACNLSPGPFTMGGSQYHPYGSNRSGQDEPAEPGSSDRTTDDYQAPYYTHHTSAGVSRAQLLTPINTNLPPHTATGTVGQAKTSHEQGDGHYAGQYGTDDTAPPGYNSYVNTPERFYGGQRSPSGRSHRTMNVAALGEMPAPVPAHIAPTGTHHRDLHQARPSQDPDAQSGDYVMGSFQELHGSQQHHERFSWESPKTPIPANVPVWPRYTTVPTSREAGDSASCPVMFVGPSLHVPTSAISPQASEGLGSPRSAGVYFPPRSAEERQDPDDSYFYGSFGSGYREGR